MPIKIQSLVEGSKSATGIVVIIDVLRACTTIPILLKNGAQEIIPVSTLEEAEEYESEGYILIGEGEHGHIHDTYHHNNSPSEIYAIDFTGKKVVLRTNNATQAILNAGKASDIILASFVNLTACAGYIKTHHIKDITLVPLGRLGKKGLEDELCAQAIKSVLEGKPFDFREMKEQISNCETAILVKETLKRPKDVELSLDMDSYPIVPIVCLENSKRIIRAIV
ncbi:MAG: 2-phosphosulfolactate phosphatase [archaeon]